MKQKLTLTLILCCIGNNIIGMDNNKPKPSHISPINSHAAPQASTSTNLIRRYSETADDIVSSKSTQTKAPRQSLDVKTFCTVHVANCLSQLDGEHKKIFITNLNASFMQTYMKARRALEALKNYQEKKEKPKSPENNMRTRSLSDSQKRTPMRQRIFREQQMREKIEEEVQGLEQSLIKDSIESEKDYSGNVLVFEGDASTLDPFSDYETASDSE